MDNKIYYIRIHKLNQNTDKTVSHPKNIHDKLPLHANKNKTSYH